MDNQVIIQAGIWFAKLDEIERLTAEIEQYKALYDACMDMAYADAVGGAESWGRMYDALKALSAGEERTETDGEMDAAESGQCQHLWQTHTLGDQSRTYCMYCDEEKPVESGRELVDKCPHCGWIICTCEDDLAEDIQK